MPLSFYLSFVFCLYFYLHFSLRAFFIFICAVLSLTACGSGSTENNDESDVADLESLSAALSETNLTVNERGNILSMQVSEAEFTAWNRGEAYKDIREKTNQIYQSFQDEFDFIIFVSANDSTPTNLYSGRLFRVQNQVEGLGIPIYSNALDYGSPGRLKAVIHMAYLHSILYGPMLHEIAHLWGNFIFSAKGLGQTGEVQLPSHWGYSNVGGQLGGFDEFRNLGGNLYEASRDSVRGNFGSIANGGNSLPYASMELYLMGLLNDQEVPTLHYFEGLQASSSEIRQGRFHANRKVSLSIQQIQQNHGVRDPDISQSQKDFNILFVLLSSAPLSTEQWNTVQNQAITFTLGEEDENTRNYNFWEATGGRARLNLPKLWQILQ